MLRRGLLMSDDITWLVHVIHSDIDAAIRNVYADARFRFENPDVHYHETEYQPISCTTPNCGGVDPRIYVLRELQHMMEEAEEKLSAINVALAGLGKPTNKNKERHAWHYRKNDPNASWNLPK